MFFDNNAHKYFVVENGIEYEGFYTESFPIIKYNDDSKYFYYLNEKAN
jgi:hypothetical protein